MHAAPLSVIVIARNEERNLPACLRTVSWAEQIVVVDTGSTDRTVDCARQFTTDVHLQPGAGFVDAKRFAVAQCRNPWVLWIDADERIPKELGDEIRSHIAQPRSHRAFAIARRAFFLGKWIKHCGWYPGYVTRLFMKEHARFSDHKVHETLIVDGSTGRCTHDMLHYTDDSLQHYFRKFNDYTSLAAQEMIHDGTRASLSDLLLRPPLTFLRMYVAKAGFLDGLHGFVLCLLSAGYVFVKYAKVWERTLDTRSGEGQ